MARRHEFVMEGGGWLLLLIALGALLYFLFHPKGQQAVSSTVAPTPGVPKVTSDIADAIASGKISARLYSPGQACSANETLMDAGSGVLWCIQQPGGLPS